MFLQIDMFAQHAVRQRIGIGLDHDLVRGLHLGDRELDTSLPLEPTNVGGNRHVELRKRGSGVDGAIEPGQQIVQRGNGVRQLYLRRGSLVEALEKSLGLGLQKGIDLIRGDHTGALRLGHRIRLANELQCREDDQQHRSETQDDPFRMQFPNGDAFGLHDDRLQ